MYISIDMQTLRFLHKHENPRVVADLDFICGKGEVVSMGPVGCASIFDHFTHLEKDKLFENTTGQKPTSSTPAFSAVLAELTLLVPVTDANPFEADRQAAWLEQKGSPSGYKYVAGATVPGKGQATLFPAVTVTPELCRAAISKHAAAKPAPAPALPAAPASPAYKPPPAAVTRPRSGVCALIWEVLDKEKAKDGEVPSRNRIKELAAEHGWNPSTASVQSAAWKRANNFA
jgi:hypothetical protein